MRRLQIVMPMGGLGSRFAKAGFATPKPLLPVDGVPMFRKALSSFDGITAPKTYTLVIRQEHVDQYGLDRLITDALPEATVVVIPKVTRGAAETAMASMPKLARDDGVIFMDCDFWFASRDYEHMVQKSLADELDIAAGLLTFHATDPRYSFAEVDADGYVARTAEKVAISDRAIWGSYFFARAGLFEAAARELMAQPLGSDLKEYYISPLYNILLNQGQKVKAAMVDEFGSFGTPEELDRYVWGAMWSRAKALYERYSSPELWRYLVIAVVLVGVEVATFQLMLSAGISYLIATPVSMIIAIVLNWLASRLWVFKHRPHTPGKEFMLVAIASAVGLALQLAVTIFVVQVWHGAPLIGKLIAICVTFFWNFWFRKKYIFFDPASRELLR